MSLDATHFSPHSIQQRQSARPREAVPDQSAPSQELEIHFCGESSQAKLRAFYRASGLTNRADLLLISRPLPPAYAIPTLMQHPLCFLINQKKVVLTYEELLKSYVEQQHSSIQIENLLQVLGTSWINESLQGILPAVANFSRGGVVTLIHLGQKEPSPVFDYRLVSLLAKRYLFSQICFQIRYSTHEKRCFGFRALMETPLEGIAEISVGPEAGLEQKFINIEYLKQCQKQQNNREGRCDAFFQELYEGDVYNPLRNFINSSGCIDKQEINPLFMQMRCQDLWGEMFYFDLHAGVAPVAMFTCQGPTLNLAPLLGGRKIEFEGTLQDLFDGRNQIARLKNIPESSLPHAFSKYWLYVTLGYQGAALGDELKLSKAFSKFSVVDICRELSESLARQEADVKFAFLFNACKALAISEEDRSKIWRHFVSIIPTSPFLLALYKIIHAQSVNSEGFFAGVELLAFRLLALPVRSAYLAEHEGRYVIRLHHLQLSLSLEKSLQTFLAETHDKENVLKPLWELFPATSIAPTAYTKELQLDFPPLTEPLLQGSSHANPNVRRICRDLLIQVLNSSSKKEMGKGLLLGVAQLLSNERSPEKQQRLVTAVALHFGFSWELNGSRTLEDFQGALVTALANARDEFLHPIALEMWEGLPSARKKVLAKPLAEMLIKNGSLQLLKVLKIGISEGFWEREQADILIRNAISLLPGVPAGQRFQIVYGIVDLLNPGSDFVYTLLDDLFAGSDQESACTFTLECTKRGILLNEAIAASVELLREAASPAEPLLQKLYEGWKAANETASRVYLYLFQGLVQHADNREAYCALWLNQTLQQQPAKAQLLLLEFTARNLPTRGPGLALFHLQLALELHRDEARKYVRENNFWQESDFKNYFEKFLQIYQHVGGDAELRTRLLAACNGEEQIKIVLRNFPNLQDKKELQLFSKGVCQKLNQFFEAAAVKELSILLKTSLQPQEMRERLVIALAKTGVDSLQTLAGEIWALLPIAAKQKTAEALLEALKKYPAQLLRLLKLGIGFWEGERVRTLILESAPSESETLLDLLVFYSLHDVALRLLKNYLTQSDLEKASQFARECEKRGLIVNPDISAAVQQNSDEALVQRLFKCWRDDAEAIASAVFLMLFSRLMVPLSWPTWLSQAGPKAQTLLEELIRKGVLTPSAETGRLLLDVCVNDPSLCGFVRERNLWQESDFRDHFDRFLPLAMRHTALRKSLLAVRPDHAGLLEEERKAEVAGLQVHDLNSFKRLLAIAQPKTEGRVVQEAADRLLPRLFSLSRTVEEPLQVLESLHTAYSYISITPCLQNFPFETASSAALTTCSRFIGSDHSLASRLISRFITPKGIATAFEMLQQFQVKDESLWQRAVTVAVDTHKPDFLMQAWEVVQAENFEIEKLRLLLALSLCEKADPKWESEIRTRLKAFEKNRERLTRSLELLLAEPPEKVAFLFDAMVLARNCLGTELLDLDVKFVKCSFRTGKAEQIEVGLKKLKSHIQCTEFHSLVEMAFVRAKQHEGLGELLGDICDQYYDIANKLPQSILEMLVNSSFPTLQYRALAIALKVPCERVKKTQELQNGYQKLAEIVPLADIPQFLLHCASLLSQDVLGAKIILYLESLMAARKDSEEPLDPAGLNLVNALLPHLSNKMQLKCFDKALDYFFLFLLQLHPFPVECEIMIAGFMEMNNSYYELSKETLRNECNSFVFRAVAGTFVRELSPASLFSLLHIHMVNVLKLSSNVGFLKEKKPFPYKELNEKLEPVKEGLKQSELSLHLRPNQDRSKSILSDQTDFDFFMKVDTLSKAPGASIQMTHAKGEQSNFHFDLGKLLIDKCLQLRPQGLSSQAMAMTLTSKTLKVMIENFPDRHHEWMPRFMQFATCPNGFNQAYYGFHLIDVQTIQLWVAKSVPEVFAFYPKILFQLSFFFDHKLVPGKGVETIEEQIESLLQLLNASWESDNLRVSRRTPAFIQAVCNELLYHQKDQYVLWYNRLIDLMRENRDYSGPTTKGLFRVKEDLSEALFKDGSGPFRGRYEACKQIHGQRWTDIVDIFVDHLEHDPDLFPTAWEYLQLVEMEFVTEENSDIFETAQMRFMLSALSWNERALLEMKEDKEMVKLATHCNRLTILKGDLSLTVESVCLSTLHAIWQRSMEQIIFKLRSLPINAINETTYPLSQSALFSDCGPTNELLHEVIATFWREGRTIFVSQGDFEGYFKIVLNLTIVCFTRFRKNDSLTIYITHIFNCMTEKFAEETEESKKQRSTYLLEVLEVVFSANDPVANEKAFVHLLQERKLSDYFEAGSDDLERAEELLKEIKQNLPQKALI